MLLKKGLVDPVSRVTLQFKASTQRQIEAYCKLYAENYGEAISSSLLVEELLRNVFLADKQFQKYLAELEAKNEGSADA